MFDPSFDEIQKSHLDLTVAGTEGAITMVESQGSEVSNELMVKAFEFAHTIIREFCNAQKDFLAEYTKVHVLPETTLTVTETDECVLAKVRELISEEQIQ